VRLQALREVRLKPDTTHSPAEAGHHTKSQIVVSGGLNANAINDSSARSTPARIFTKYLVPDLTT